MSVVLQLIRILAVACLLVAAKAASAECAGQPGDGGSCSDVRTTLIYVDAAGDAYIAVSGNVSALSCSPIGNLLRLSSTAVNFKLVYATLLAAHLLGRPINVRLTPGTPQCVIAYVTVP